MPGKEDAAEADMDEKTRPHTLRTNSSTEAEPDQELQDNLARESKEDERGFRPSGEPDINHDEIEAIVPGHELDVELGKVSNPPLVVVNVLGFDTQMPESRCRRAREDRDPG